MHGFLLELMREVRAVLPVPRRPAIHLVPELLGKDQPKEAEAGSCRRSA